MRPQVHGCRNDCDSDSDCDCHRPTVTVAVTVTVTVTVTATVIVTALTVAADLHQRHRACPMAEQPTMTRRSLRREQRVTVQGPDRKPSKDGMLHMGGEGGVKLVLSLGGDFSLCFCADRLLCARALAQVSGGGGGIRMAVHRRRRPPPPDQSDHRGKKTKFTIGKIGHFLGPRPLLSPPF